MYTYMYIMSDEYGNYTIKSPFEGTNMIMQTRAQNKVYKDSLQRFQIRSLYNLAGLQFVIPTPAIKGKIGVVETPAKLKDQANAVIDSHQITFRSGSPYINPPSQQMLDLCKELKSPSRECYLITDSQLKDWQTLSAAAQNSVNELSEMIRE